MGRATKSPRKTSSRVSLMDAGAQNIVSEETSRCWRFVVIGSTAGAVHVGSRITGAIVHNRVVVSTATESLGFAPNNIAIQLIKAVRTTGKKLSGHVLVIKE